MVDAGEAKASTETGDSEPLPAWEAVGGGGET